MCCYSDRLQARQRDSRRQHQRRLPGQRGCGDRARPEWLSSRAPADRVPRVANVPNAFITTALREGKVLEVVPGNFFFLGVRNDERGINAPHHNPRFDIHEACLPVGAAILCDAATRCLNGEG